MKRSPTIIFLLVLMILSASGCQRRAKNESALEHGEHNFTISHDGLERKYKLYIPESYSNASPAPLVVYLHGGGGNNKSMFADGLDQYAEQYGFIVAAPNGTGRLPNKLLTWNGGAWSTGACCGQAVENNVDDVGFISAMLDDIESKVSVDARRVYVTGLSNGGMMTYRLACELADRIAAVAPVSPPAIPDACLPSRAVPIMHIHGTADTCTPYHGGPGGGCLFNTPPIFVAQSAQGMVDAWLRMDGITSTPETTYQHDDASCLTYSGSGVEVVLCAIQNGGHAWIGVNPKEESPSNDITFEQIWEFFARHRLP